MRSRPSWCRSACTTRWCSRRIPPGSSCFGVTVRNSRRAPTPLPRRLWFVLVCPPFGLSTAEVYRGVQVPERPRDAEGMRRALTAGDVAEIGRRLHNRLQPPALALRPELATYLERLAALGP